jgi:hypothetical protein
VLFQNLARRLGQPVEEAAVLPLRLRQRFRPLMVMSRRGRVRLDETGGREMTGRKGDRIVVESERAAQSGRAGVFEKVLEKEPPRYEVRWDDGHTSIFSPSAGAATIEQTSKKVYAQ